MGGGCVLNANNLHHPLDTRCRCVINASRFSKLFPDLSLSYVSQSDRAPAQINTCQIMWGKGSDRTAEKPKPRAHSRLYPRLPFVRSDISCSSHSADTFTHCPFSVLHSHLNPFFLVQHVYSNRYVPAEADPSVGHHAHSR